MKKTKKMLLGAIVAICVCVSVICGATYALFTSESTVNIAVTSGTVSVTATVDKASVQSHALGETYKDGEGNTYTKEVTVADDGEVTLKNFVPGDAVKFNIVVANHSTVAVKYRTSLSATGDVKLLDGLVMTIGGEKVDGATTVTKWADFAVKADPKTLAVEIVFPEKAGNEYQGLTCTVQYFVEAVQGNASVKDGVVFIGDTGYATLKEAVAAAQEGDTLSIEKDLTVRGQVKVGKALTIEGNGHTVTMYHTSDCLDAAKPVTLQNIHFDCYSDTRAGLRLRGAYMHTLTNVRVSGAAHEAMVDFNGSSGGIMTDCTVTNDYPEEKSYWYPYGEGTLDIFVNRNTRAENEAEEGGIKLELIRTTADRILVNGSKSAYNVPKTYVKEGSVVDKAYYCSAEVPASKAIVVEEGATVDAILAPQAYKKDVGFFRDMKEDATYKIFNANGLRTFAELVNGGITYAGAIVTLEADIDLGGEVMAPIGTQEHPFLGTFDGKGHTVRGLIVGDAATAIAERQENVGLFGYIGYTEKLNKHDLTGVGRNLIDRTKSVHATVRNLTLEGVHAYGIVAGAAVGYCNTSTVENVVVKDAVLDGGHYVGGVVGYVTCESRIVNCTVTGAHLKATVYSNGTKDENEIDYFDKGDKVGGIVGLLQGSEISDCSVENVDIAGYRDLGGIVGICNNGDAWKIGGGKPYAEDPVEKTEDSYFGLGCTVQGNTAKDVRIAYNNEVTDADNGNGNVHGIVGRNNSTLNGNAKDSAYHADHEEDKNTAENVTLPQ